MKLHLDLYPLLPSEVATYIAWHARSCDEVPQGVSDFDVVKTFLEVACLKFIGNLVDFAKEELRGLKTEEDRLNSLRAGLPGSSNAGSL